VTSIPEKWPIAPESHYNVKQAFVNSYEYLGNVSYPCHIIKPPIIATKLFRAPQGMKKLSEEAGLVTY